MSQFSNFKEVEFDKYCKKCKYFSLKEAQDPCYLCLACGARPETSVPLKFEKKEK